MHRTASSLALLATLLVPTAAAAPQAAGEEPQGMFRWAQTPEDLGTVAVPSIGGAGWKHGPSGVLYRSVPSFSGDPTFEVVIRAPYSGSPLYPERLLVQLPVGFASKPFQERCVVVGFHGFSASEKDIFVNTTLPYEAAERGWMLVAPYGLTDTSFGNVASQASLQAVSHLLFSQVPFNYRRVYAVGFSMGGLSALSFAMRNLDPQELQFAGVVLHTPCLDMVKAHAAADLPLQLLLEDSRHFGGSPSSVPFEYDRISPVRFDSSGLVDPDLAPVVNFSHRPIYLHVNLADPNTELLAGVVAMRNFLQQRGGLVMEDLVHSPVAGHSWDTLQLGPALDWVAGFELESSPPPTVELFTDDPGRWLHAEVETISPEAFGRFRLAMAPLGTGTLNSLALDGTRDLDELALDLEVIGLDAARPLSLTHESADGTADVLRLRGYATAPASISVDGEPPAWSSHHAPTQELWLRPTEDGRAVRVDITP